MMGKDELFLTVLEKIDRVKESYRFSKQELFYIIEENTGTSAVAEYEVDKKAFCIINPHRKTIHFLPIDGKQGVLAYDDSYCDALIFDNTIASFLEFKLNATSTEERAIRKNRKKAISQLKNTIAFFDQKLNNDYKGLALEAIVVTPETYPRADTSWSDMSIEFLEETGISLFEKTEKEY